MSILSGLRSNILVKLGRRWLFTTAQLVTKFDRLPKPDANHQTVAAEPDVEFDFDELEADKQRLVLSKMINRVTGRKVIKRIIDYRIKTIQSASGNSLTEVDAAQIANIIPPFFFLNNQAISMIQLLSEYKCNIKDIIVKHPTVLGLTVSKCKDNLLNLKQMISDQSPGKEDLNDIVRQIINANPMILILPTDVFASSVLAKAKFHKLDPAWLISDVKKTVKESSLIYFPLEDDNLENLEQIIHLFYDVDIQPHVVFANTPEIFRLPYDRVHDTYRRLVSKPFHMNSKDVKRIFEQHGRFVTLIDTEFIYPQYERLLQLIPCRREDNSAYQMIVRYPEVLLEECDVRKTIQLFRSYNFTMENIAKLYRTLYKSRCFTSPLEVNLIPLLKVLLGYGDITVTDIMKTPRILVSRHKQAEKRLEFLRARNPQLLANEDIALLLQCRTHKFAEMCKFSDEEMKEYVTVLEG